MNTKSILEVNFFQTSTGKEPVREWLKNMKIGNRKIIGEDIKLVQFRWPFGMPLLSEKCKPTYGKFAVN